MMKNLTRYLWNRSARCIAFWFIAVASAMALYVVWASLSLPILLEISLEGFSGELSRVTTAAFSFSLAKALVSVAFGLLIAFGVMHAAMTSISIRGARVFIESFPSKRIFASDFDQIRRRMAADPLLGHAWKAFEDSLLTGGAPLRTTQRPQNFFNTAMLREKLIGLKIMPATPSYFVGAGLLLTFIGLLIALYKAAEGMQAVQLATGGAGAAATQAALRELTQAATFQFATSIAGLSSSIILAFAFRLYTIRMEVSLRDFCEAVESKLSYLSSQSVSIEMRDSLAELEKIHSEQFLARFGEEVASALEPAVDEAVKQAMDAVVMGQDAAGNSRQGLATQVDRVTGLWENYESRFDNTDENLERAFEKLAQLRGTHPRQLAEGANQTVDKGVAGAADKFAGPVQGVEDGAKDLFDAVGKLRHILKEARAAA